MAHVTDLGFTEADLLTALSNGEVRVQTHPDFPELTIWNYTEETQFRNKWNKVTLACRGLILNNQTGEVVARPWEKFFNFGQMDNRIDSMAPVEVTDKMDGSLGILYRRPDRHWAIATRGSFTSEQAIHATKIFNGRYRDLMLLGRPGAPKSEFDRPVVTQEWLDHLDSFTLLFEIIYPENRIVVNYEDMDDLVVIGAVNKEYGHYYGPDAAANMAMLVGPDAPPRAEVFKAKHFVDALSLPDRAGKEGYVIRSGRNIVKLKQADYVELHRIVTNLSPKTIWEMLQRGETQESICVNIPDEFHGYVKDITGKLEMDFLGIKVDTRLDFQKIKHKLWKDDGETISRRAWAEEIKKSKYPGLLFMMLDGKPIDEAIWKMIKPRGDVKSLVEDEG